MMRILTYFVCGIFVASTVVSPSLSYGDAVKVSTDKETATQASGSSSGGSSTPSVNDSANKAADSNSKGQMMSMLVGTGLTITGTTMISSSNPGTVAAGYVLLGMGVLSFMQGGAHGKTAGTAGLTSNQSDGYSDLYGTGGGLTAETAAETKAAQDALNKLEKSGIYNPKTGTIKTSTGKTYNVSDFSSKESMAAAGLPSGMIDGAYAYAEKLAKNAEKKVDKMKLGAMTASNGFADGGGAGGGAPAPVGGSDPFAMMGGSGGGMGTGAGSAMDRDPSSLAGMQKNYNGEPIGVSADSIFLMMTRRYKVKESQESFYSDADLALKK